MIKSKKQFELLKAYIPGRPIEEVKEKYNLEYIVKLASNENPYGTSSLVKDALIEFLENYNLNRYPDGFSSKLKYDLSDFYDIETKNIIISNGADEMLDIIAKTFLSENDNVIMNEMTFVRYSDVSTIQDSNIKIVRLKNFDTILDSYLEKIDENTKLIWLCNPNNPTGKYLDKQQIKNFIEKVPSNILILYDEAYAEFAEDNTIPQDMIYEFKKHENVMTLKTFSKIYGLASLRIGYLFANEDIITELNKARPPFNVNALAQIAAINALKDQEFVEFVKSENIKQKYYLYEQFKKLGISYVESQTNFILFKTDFDSLELFEKLMQKGVIIRAQKNGYQRVTIGTSQENEIFIEKLEEIIKQK